MGRGVDLGLLVIRVGVGLFFAVTHGLPKLLAGPDRWAGLGEAIGALGLPVVMPVVFGFLAGLAEFGGGLLIALGLFTRYAAGALLITMIVASATKLTGGDLSFATFGRDAARPMEMAVIFLGLMISGPGRYALGRRRRALD